MEQYKLPERLRIGTRGSRLALAQTDLFIKLLQSRYPEIRCEKVIIKTAGDQIIDKPLREFGGKAVFVTEIEEAVREGRIDLAVHSAKDMPTELAEGLSIVCVLPREDVRDVLITRKGVSVSVFAQKGAVIGTGSPRRQQQIRQRYPGMRCESLRGNVPTRLEKLKQGAYDGILLAAAGLKRLQLLDDPELEYTFLSADEMIPAGGQAIIAIEGREGKEQEFLRVLTDRKAHLELETERFLLQYLNAGCHEAVGVYAELTGTPQSLEEEIRIRLMKEYAGRIFRKEGSATVQDREKLARRLADELMREAGER